MTAPEATGERLARMETKLDALLTQFSGHETRVQTSVTDHETRIRRLERALWIAAGAGLLGGGGLGAVAAQLMGG